MLLHKDSIQFFNFENEPGILKAYFCYLIYVFSSRIKEFELNNKNVQDQIDLSKFDKYDFNMLLSHFRNVLNQAREKEFFKILKQNSKTDVSWNFIIDRFKN